MRATTCWWDVSILFAVYVARRMSHRMNPASIAHATRLIASHLSGIPVMFGRIQPAIHSMSCAMPRYDPAQGGARLVRNHRK